MNEVNEVNMMNRALLIGLEYNDTLNGPYNDIKILSNVLKNKGYTVKIITDTSNTREDIKNGIKWLHHSDTGIVYFHFSGHSEKNKLIINKDENITTRYITKYKKEKTTMIASFDCCNSTNFPLRWKLSNDELISNSCQYNINDDIIFIGSSNELSRNISYKKREYGSLSFAMFWILKEKDQMTLLELRMLLYKIYNDFNVSENISIYTGKKYDKYYIIKI